MNLSQAIKEEIILLASFAGRDVNQMILDGYMRAVSDLDQGLVLKSLRDWTKTGKGFPQPADIRARVMPEIDGRDEGLEVSNLIIKCVCRFGYTNPKAAQEAMGDLAWEVVKSIGGWKHICETLDFNNETIFRAQVRDTAQALSKRAKRGELNQTPELPKSNAVSDLISNTMKGLEIKNV